MNKGLSVPEMLANLETRICHHRERRAFHAEQEVHHHDQCAFHDAELAKILERYEAFKAAADAASDYAEPPARPAREVPEPEEEIPLFGTRPMVSRLIGRVVERQQAGEAFGARAIAAAVNQRYAGKLPRRVASDDVSVVLRRLRDAGRIHSVRPGRAAHETLYKLGPKPARG